eukprot:jgi/Mesen1/4789/ME000242S03962
MHSPIMALAAETDSASAQGIDAEEDVEFDIGSLELSELTAVTPLDGRYGSRVKELRGLFSEYALIRYRVLVEIMWLIKLSQIEGVAEVPALSASAIADLEAYAASFSPKHAAQVKATERITNHDVKAVEYVLRERFQSHPEISKVVEFIHFACTSEDINNLAHALMLRDAIAGQILPTMDALVAKLTALAHEHAGQPMLSRTHGQTASPTTMGKEIANFAYRLARQRRQLSSVELYGKMAGAVGNYNAHVAAYPDVDWHQVAREFVTAVAPDYITGNSMIAGVMGAHFLFSGYFIAKKVQ